MRRPPGGWFVALPCLVACATGGPPPSPPPEPARPPPPPAAAAAPVPVPLPCAGIGADTSRLGHPFGPPPGTGIRHLDELASNGEVVWTSEVAGKPVDWVMRPTAGQAHMLWALRRVEGGWCVLGSFASSEPVKSPMTMPDRALTGKTAVALVRFESLPDERSGVSNRYVGLATDGERLWFTLEGKGGHHLIAREAKLRKQGATLFLDVPTPSGATAVLKFDGTRFVKLN